MFSYYFLLTFRSRYALLIIFAWKRRVKKFLIITIIVVDLITLPTGTLRFYLFTDCQSNQQLVGEVIYLTDLFPSSVL